MLLFFYLVYIYELFRTLNHFTNYFILHPLTNNQGATRAIAPFILGLEIFYLVM